MSKYQFQESDIYIPGTEIPANRLGIEDAELLGEVEATLLQQAYHILIAELGAETRFDEAYYRSLHRQTFESLYDWAGSYRTEDMVKGGTPRLLPRRAHRAATISRTERPHHPFFHRYHCHLQRLRAD